MKLLNKLIMVYFLLDICLTINTHLDRTANTPRFGANEIDKEKG